ncbi:MAG: hypothetical protein WBP41_04640 [Saprospiraceae bacterium]
MKWTRYVFFIFWALTLLSFIPSIGAGFVFDFLGWQNAYAHGSFRDILNCFGYPGNQQFLHLVFYSFYKIFGIQGFWWYLFFCTLHALNGYILYLFILRIGQKWGGAISPVLAALCAVLFLLHPYEIEAVVWKVCVHYLLSCTELLLIFLAFLSYTESGERKMILCGSLIFLISLFTLELSLITPLALTLFGLISYLISANHNKQILTRGLRFTGITWLLTICYLILNKITLGSIVGHYGEKVHLQFNLITIVSTEMKYLFKHLFYARFYSFKIKAILFDQFLSYPEVVFFLLTGMMSVFILYFIKINKLAFTTHVAFLGLCTSFLFLLPVSNMYFFHLGVGMNDRYSYIPMAFLCLALAGILSKCSGWVRILVISIYLIPCIFYQQKTLRYWEQSTEVLQSLKMSFRWHDAPFVFVLNSPDNFNGIIMASISNVPSGIEELIDFQTPHPFNGKMIDVLQFNMTTMNDGVKVEQVGPRQLKVTFNQWGNWWHRLGIGATSYENEYYKVETLDYPYLVTFKQIPQGSVFLYQDGKELKEFKFDEGI